jgi:hypothetical protein
MAVLRQDAVGRNLEAQRRRNVKILKDAAWKLVV